MQGRRRRSGRHRLYAWVQRARAREGQILPSDALILDLEEALAPDAKQLARDRVCDAVKGGAYGAREIIIRVNALETPGEPRTCSLFAMRRVTRFWCRR